MSGGCVWWILLILGVIGVFCTSSHIAKCTMQSYGSSGFAWKFCDGRLTFDYVLMICSLWCILMVVLKISEQYLKEVEKRET